MVQKAPLWCLRRLSGRLRVDEHLVPASGQDGHAPVARSWAVSVAPSSVSTDLEQRGEACVFSSCKKQRKRSKSTHLLICPPQKKKLFFCKKGDRKGNISGTKLLPTSGGRATTALTRTHVLGRASTRDLTTVNAACWRTHLLFHESKTSCRLTLNIPL